LTGHEGRINNLAFTNDGRNLISTGMDRTARLWDVASGKELRTLFRGSCPVYALAISSDGGSLATGSYWSYSITEQPELRIWDAKIWQERFCCPVPSYDGGGITSLAFSHDSQRLVLTTIYHQTVVDVKTGSAVLNLRSTRRLVRALAYSSQGQIAWGGLDGEVMTWQESPHHYLAPVLATLLPAPQLFKATSSLAAFQAMPDAILPAHGSRSVNVAFTSDGARLASCGVDGGIKIWDHKGEQWVERGLLRGHLGPVHALTFLPDGRFLISGGQDGTIRIWNMESGSQVHELRGHSDCVYCLALSPDGNYLASGDSQGHIGIWDARGFSQQLAEGKGLSIVPVTDQMAFPSKSRAGR
jgi:WD40 repeat protein